ncbi:DUF7529 family protein [Halopiger goleimassiliensis]|uniref:DUF7529 family protein n=1 Tax=Halopiger goleimassiliensis TaxID=1293048 RepID=UPI000677BD81|nr:hypothetical protein [Halopiger goleimassiliensis]
MTDDGVSTREWDDLLADATAIADSYREEGWDVVVPAPESVSPLADDDRRGFEVLVDDETYDLLASLVDGDVSIDDAEVYYRPADGGDRRFALAVERDTDTETAVCLPLTYSMAAARPVLEAALLEEELPVYVGAAADGSEERLTFSHDDPSLFLEESDVRGWETE